MRLRFDGQIRSHDESWKSWLTQVQIEAFERKAGDVNRGLGFTEET
jgi:hypothetical protein